jgi:hypothetical protein
MKRKNTIRLSFDPVFFLQAPILEINFFIIIV